MDTILFYAFAALVLVGAVLTITCKNAVHSAIALICSLLGVAGLYLLQQAEFLFAVQIILYVGGIMLLFLFVIPIRAWLFVTLYGLFEVGMGVFGYEQGVAHFAHIGGMVGGYLLIRSWRARLAAALTRAGAPPLRADRLAALLLAACEGAVVLARAERRIAERACVATASPGGRRSASPNRGRRSNSRR